MSCDRGSRELGSPGGARPLPLPPAVERKARGGGRGNVESRVIGPARLNAASMRLMPGHGALIALCKSQGGPSRPHSYIINGLTLAIDAETAGRSHAFSERIL